MGFLDQLLGNADQTQALGLLGSYMMAGRAPEGFAQAMGLLSPDRALERQYKQAQLADVQQQIELRKQQASQLERRNGMIAGLLGQMDDNVPRANQAVIAQTGNLAPTVANAGLQQRALGQLNSSNPLFGLPREAVQFDLATNDGKNVGNWIFDRNKPNIEFVNGVPVDKNRTDMNQTIPQMSATGQGYQIMRDAQAPGGFSIISPNGAAQVQAQSALIPKLVEAATTMRDTKDPNGQVRTMTGLQALDQTGGLPMLSQMFPAIFGGQQPNAPMATPAQRTTVPPATGQLQNNGLPLTPALQAAIVADARWNGIANPVASLSSAEPGMPSASNFKRPQIGLASEAGPNAPAADVKPGFASGPTTAQDRFNQTIGEKNAGQVDEAYTRATAAKQALPSIWQAQQIVKDGVITGLGSDAKLNLVRALSAIGIPVPDSAANSQELDAVLAQVAGKNIKSIVGSQNISNSDVNFVRQMFGTRGQEGKALQFLLQKAEEANFRDINGYNSMLPEVRDNGGAPVLGEVKPPVRPMTGIPSGAVQMLKSNPSLRAQFDSKYGQGAADAVLGR